ncbi:MoaD/ThiS family protein [Mesorhizobium australicum]|uniref:Molybdopterin synthase subunit MoaD n=1 Tax=Mesorhizobium australicum TaxID=536018 RepID=A0A1X7P764_9HYPH|nr:MoaD/ThiS family protein [Mesorhizobium australicum]SMH46828.1 molybdopterin synthase subunit MoaD [Mesorhizobium australicum]
MGEGSAGNPVTVRLQGVMVDLFPGSTRRVEMSARTVDEMIDELDRRWPGMADRIRDTRPAIRKHMNVFVDGERAKLDTKLPPGTEVFVFTAISGG